MEVHRRLETRLRHGILPSANDVRRRLDEEIGKGLFQKRLAFSDVEIIARLATVDPGLDDLADLIVSDAPNWALDPCNNQDALVWVEAPLDHGPSVPAVEIAPGRLVKTRPDVIGLRRLESGLYRAVIRDFKVKRQVVRPESDHGILVRALWVLAEAQNPRCQWFIARRGIEIDLSQIDLEVVNLMWADTEDFLVRAAVSETDLRILREHVVAALDRAEAVISETNVDNVEASPSEFCSSWCPFLNRCQPGTDWVRRYKGDDALQVRLAQA
jgi:hypothetical protein